MPLLQSDDDGLCLYAAAALMNMSQDDQIAQRALAVGAHRILEALVCSYSVSKQTVRYAAGVPRCE